MGVIQFNPTILLNNLFYIFKRSSLEIQGGEKMLFYFLNRNAAAFTFFKIKTSEKLDH